MNVRNRHPPNSNYVFFYILLYYQKIFHHVLIENSAPCFPLDCFADGDEDDIYTNIEPIGFKF